MASPSSISVGTVCCGLNCLIGIDQNESSVIRNELAQYVNVSLYLQKLITQMLTGEKIHISGETNLYFHHLEILFKNWL